MTGICTMCEREVPISFSHLARQEAEERGMDHEEIEMVYGDSINYLCDTHDCYGEHCEGSGQIPQVIVRKG